MRRSEFHLTICGLGHITRVRNKNPVRNLFDQYAQPENKLTHALVCTLQREEKLIRPFLRLLKISKILPLKKKIQVVEQQIPGEGESRNENESNGVPDACFFDDDSWAVLVESKVNSKPTPKLPRGAAIKAPK